MKIENIGEMVDEAYAEKSLAEIAASPVYALKGVSEADAEKLKTAFGIETVSDMAKLKYYGWAQEIKTRADKQ